MGSENFPISMFFAFHVAGGQIGMLLLLLTILLSRKTTRHPIFINFCASWILFSLSYLILFYAGQKSNPQPTFSICVTQASMVYGAPPLVAFSTLILVFHIFSQLRNAIFEGSASRFRTIILVMALLTPYILYLTVFFIVLIAGINNPDKISRATYYCRIEISSVSHIAPWISVVAMIGVVISETMITLTLYRHWRTFRKIDVTAKTGLTVHFMLRALVFTLFAFFALMGSIVSLFASDASAANVVIALLPVAAFIVFGTQTDLWRGWSLRNSISTTSRSSLHKLDPDSSSISKSSV